MTPCDGCLLWQLCQHKMLYFLTLCLYEMLVYILIMVMGMHTIIKKVFIDYWHYCYLQYLLSFVPCVGIAFISCAKCINLYHIWSFSRCPCKKIKFVAAQPSFIKITSSVSSASCHSRYIKECFLHSTRISVSLKLCKVYVKYSRFDMGGKIIPECCVF